MTTTRRTILGPAPTSLLAAGLVLASGACVPDRETSTWSDTAVVTGELGAADYGPATWSPTGNYYNASRKVGQVKIVVVHTTQGSFGGAVSWIKNPKSKVSAHFVISQKGEVVQMVKEEDIAWHVGSENGHTIGIEHEGFVSDPKWVTPQMLDASSKLTCYLVKKWKLAPTKANIKGHVELPNQTHTDPGKYWPWPQYIQMVANCVNGVPLTCPGGCGDGNPCTADTCSAGKCTHSPATGTCSDGNACTAGDACSGGKCSSGKQKNCDDGNPCTADTCTSSTGACKHAAASGACSDGDACTSGDQCSAGKCASGKAKVCDDGKPCTDDGCDTKSGACTASPNTGKACSDGDACTAKDACKSGVCTAGAPTSCDDGNPCTSDACIAGKCQSAAWTGTCDDGEPCTVGDNCLTGVCLGAPIYCQDANPCTSDACVGGVCKHQAIGGGCDDGDGCTIGDWCAQGLCLAGALASCDDGLPCTFDACHKGQCEHTGGKPSTAVCIDNAVHIVDPCGMTGPVHEVCSLARPCVDGACGLGADALDDGDVGAGDVGAGDVGDGDVGDGDVGDGDAGGDGSAHGPDADAAALADGAATADGAGTSTSSYGPPPSGCGAGPQPGLGGKVALLLAVAALAPWLRRRAELGWGRGGHGA